MGEGDFSVLIGVYGKDDPDYFKEAMDSLLQQTIKSDDIVLSIDGPLEKSLDIVVKDYIKKYPEIHPVWFPKNVGQGRSFQQSLSLCKYDIVFRADADDISLATRFKTQLYYLEKHPDVKLLSANMLEFIDKPDNVMTMKRVPKTNAEIVQSAKRWNPINHPAAVFYKSAVFSVGGYQHFYRYEDYYLWVRMLHAGFKAANIEEVLVYYRLSSENLKRRMDWKTTKSALRFHLWKYRIGFAGWWDTCSMIGIMLGIFCTPDFLFKVIYKKMRRGQV